MLNPKSNKLRILVCGVLPPPNFGHSMMYKMLMESSFISHYDVTFLELKFWSYAKHKKVTIDKLLKMVKYWFQFIFLIITKRPRYVLFYMSFDKMPFVKDYLFCLTGKILGCRIVLHDMGQYLPELYNSSGGYLRFLIKHFLKLTHTIIVMGQKVRRDYAPFFNEQRIVVVPGVVEDTANFVVPIYPQENTVKVLYFSFLSVSKGIWTALKAIPLVVRANPSVRFTFGGPMESEELNNQIQDFVKDNNLQNYFSYVGYVEDKEKRTEYFRNTDLFIFPTHRDVFGLVILHAMAEGKPVIASIEGTIPEIVDDASSGLLFEKANPEQLAQKILQLAQDASLRTQMGFCGRKKYERCYTPGVYGSNMIEAFKVIDKASTK